MSDTEAPLTSVSPGAAPLAGTRVVLGVSGGIAAYKSVLLLRLLTSAEAYVQVVMTRAAQEFVGPTTFQALSGRPVFTDLFNLGQESEIGHVQAADGAALVVIAPATANTIARMAAGLADDALSALVLATRAPVLLAPSMNVNMWNNPATQRNLRALIERGFRTVGPDDGFLACKWTGTGRMAEPAAIMEAAAQVLSPADFAGRRVVVSAGPTHERLDPVRFLGNRSTGKMGFAIAAAAARRGAEVRLVAGPTYLPDPTGVHVVRVVSAAEMQRAVEEAAQDSDAVIMAAAVADYRPALPATDKIKKTGDELSVSLVRTTDILASLGAARAGAKATRPVLVGFAAETTDVVAYARRKLVSKQCDLIVANDVSRADAGFGTDTNRVVLVDAGGETALPLASKANVAHAILDRVITLW